MPRNTFGPGVAVASIGIPKRAAQCTVTGTAAGKPAPCKRTS